MKVVGQIHVGPTWPDEIPLPEALEAQVQRTVAEFELAALRIWFRLEGKYEPTPLLSWCPDGMLRGGFDARTVSSIVRAGTPMTRSIQSTLPSRSDPRPIHPFGELLLQRDSLTASGVLPQTLNPVSADRIALRRARRPRVLS